ncbi:alpha-ketoglutarate-dependent dioxygenase AlkB [Cyclobacterium sp. 1_MG-2023]|uniref:alpha-ketoglutarate-dependent dioxygenase AlkB family protein n=1 Tax=Cyclobacterium sp. 1_MG-2023 TaxID=3062681 RepID=UPI0026E345E4|nr:alpha-ketoglutarate-dependent dioxygenase AlkB [Cyclobacterium sp. 1_MG-2023]MDO6439296.1 alpha-ketoglutarate-dependent dioxygenase AlkB [Cyclobacterium sp. 1_MG-2023]
MELFEREKDPNKNILPFDGTVNYFGKVLDQKEADKYFSILLDSIEWKNDEAIIFGKKIITKRKVAWYGEEAFEYTYSKTTKSALPWTQALLDLKLLIEKQTGDTYNSCLLNLYHDGSEGMAWHSDAEKDLKKHGSIASLSLGAERKFAFKHKETKIKKELILENGSLLVMKGSTQNYWLHRLPPTKRVFGPRVNLTFRTILKKRDL